jgi:hypothetical protein
MEGRRFLARIRYQTCRRFAEPAASGYWFDGGSFVQSTRRQPPNVVR